MRVPRRARKSPSTKPPDSKGTGVPGGGETEANGEELRLIVANLVLAGAPTLRVIDVVNHRDCPSCKARVEVDVEVCPRCNTEQPVELVRHKLSDRSVRSYMNGARLEIQREYEERRSQLASEQVERLRNDLLRMRSSSKVPWTAVAQHERLVADITGTIAPRRVHLTGNEGLVSALSAALAGMSSEERERAVVEQRNLMRLAGRDVIEVPGEAVASSPP